MYSEPRLSFMVVSFVGVLTAVYMVVSGITWGASDNGYGVLPTFALGFATQNTHTFISLLVFTFAILLEGGILAMSMDRIREIKKEFSMLSELQIFSFIWLFFTNTTLFFVVQGPIGGWFKGSEITYYRIVFWMLLIRSLLVSLYCAVKPLYETHSNSDEMFFPIPPNRECIESVDMVLHIPIAVDYFYNYLQSRHQ
jgi:hypothetical protein